MIRKKISIIIKVIITCVLLVSAIWYIVNVICEFPCSVSSRPGQLHTSFPTLSQASRVSTTGKLKHTHGVFGENCLPRHGQSLGAQSGGPREVHVLSFAGTALC